MFDDIHDPQFHPAGNAGASIFDLKMETPKTTCHAILEARISILHWESAPKTGVDTKMWALLGSQGTN